ncbi:LuxR C-terminal-related transcriptional regulator [uncultured Adlercreutzia sp.]|uniref:helix-turn-helix transcriptional regulator n=1 Tax=uncultured Adlercreutzia sp. TaxID=875803 RepID=UPI00267699F9|nr:LuxR C-terminal-related transcriptional regulator [uncultured Adlercreutzia sp.]
MDAEGRNAVPAQSSVRLAGLRPRHAALCAFVTTLLACVPVIVIFNGAPRYAALGDLFLLCLLLGAMASGVFQCARVLRGTFRDSRRASRTAVVAYLAAILVFIVSLAAPDPWPLGASAAGIVAGCALPPVLCAWARAVAAPMDRALALCALVGGAAALLGWVLLLLPPQLLLPVFCVLAVAGTAPLLLMEPTVSPEEGTALQISSADGGKGALGRLLSVTWLPLLGLAAYVFMTGLVSHSAFGTLPATYLGALPEAALILLICARWARRPLLPWCYRVLVPLLAAAFVVLGTFPEGTFPQEASVAVLYGFYLVLAMLGCALFLAVTHSREVAPELTCSFAVAVVAAAALAAYVLSSVVMPGADFSPWLPVVTGLFVAVLLLFLGRTAWDELVTPHDDAVEGEGEEAGIVLGDRGIRAARPPVLAADGALASSTKSTDAAESKTAQSASPSTPAIPEPSVRDTLEARCAEVSAARSLSPREAEVLVYLARGFTPAYIAKSLVLSISTVRTHVRNIYRKLNVNKREELLHLIDEE